LLDQSPYLEFRHHGKRRDRKASSRDLSANSSVLVSRVKNTRHGIRTESTLSVPTASSGDVTVNSFARPGRENSSSETPGPMPSAMPPYCEYRWRERTGCRIAAWSGGSGICSLSSRSITVRSFFGLSELKAGGLFFTLNLQDLNCHPWPLTARFGIFAAITTICRRDMKSSHPSTSIPGWRHSPFKRGWQNTAKYGESHKRFSVLHPGLFRGDRCTGRRTTARRD